MVARVVHDEPSAAPWEGTRPQRRGLAVIGGVALVVSLSQTVLIPVLGELPRELDASTAQVSWLLTSTMLVSAVSVPVVCRLGDMYGRRRLLMLALVALMMGSGLAAASSGLSWLLVGRSVQGLGMAAVPLGISLLSEHLPRRRLAAGATVVSAMLGLGGAIGLPVAGLIAERADFRTLFLLPLVGGGLALAGVLRLVPESRHRTSGRVDWLGAFLLTLALTSFFLALTQSASWGWTDVRAGGLLGASGLLLLVFVRSQRSVAVPIVDLQALRRRPVPLISLTSLLFGFSLFAMMISTANFVQAPSRVGYGFDTSLMVGGLALVPAGLIMLLVAPLLSRLIAAAGASRTLAMGAFLVAAGWGARVVATDALWQVVLCSAVLGLGAGTGIAAVPPLLRQFVAVERLGAALGLNALFQTVGTCVASALGAVILSSSTVSDGALKLPSLAAYQRLFLTSSAAALLAVLTAGLLHLRGARGARLPLPVTQES